jgi:hypothetical protein
VTHPSFALERNGRDLASDDVPAELQGEFERVIGMGFDEASRSVADGAYKPSLVRSLSIM